MINYKKECQALEKTKPLVVVVDYYDENGIPVFAIRRVQKAVGSRSGRNSYWGMVIDEPLSDGCDAVSFSYILAMMDSSNPAGIIIASVCLDQYHPAWMLTPNQEQELKWRKESAIHALKTMV